MSPKKNTKINLEIERRFLLKNIPNFAGKKWTYFEIYQFYVNDNGKRVRYRESIQQNCKPIYYSTQKKLISKGTYEEKEREVSEKIFRKKFKDSKNKTEISKLRYVYQYKGLKFEIDSFDKMRLVVMEIELKDINQTIHFPDFIFKEIILEVTELKELGNFNLSRKC